jgi:hypothetical protein
MTGAGASGAGVAAPELTRSAGSRVCAPDNTGHDLRHRCRRYKLAAIEGILDLLVGHLANATAGRMAASTVVNRGNGNVEIAAVKRVRLDVNITDTGNVIVRDGEVADLMIITQHTDDAAYRGSARRANLRTLAAGGIRVDTVTEWLERREDGSGRILVRSAPTQDSGTLWG